MSDRKHHTHNNKSAFRHNPNSKKTKQIASFPNEGVCEKCWDKIEWRKKYRKYKPLTVPGRCNKCQQKTVRLAYHAYCQKCAEEAGVCGICNKEAMTKPYIRLGAPQYQVDQEEVLIKNMSERHRRTYLREKEREARGKNGDNGDDSNESFSEGSDIEEDPALDPAAAPSYRKFDPDMLVKERAAKATLKAQDAHKESGAAPSEPGTSAANGTSQAPAGTKTKQESSAPKKAPKHEEDDDLDGSEDLDGSAESYEEDSEEIERIEAEARKLMEEKLVGATGDEENEELDDGEEGDDAGSEDEDESDKAKK